MRASSATVTRASPREDRGAARGFEARRRGECGVVELALHGEAA